MQYRLRAALDSHLPVMATAPVMIKATAAYLYKKPSQAHYLRSALIAGDEEAAELCCMVFSIKMLLSDFRR